MNNQNTVVWKVVFLLLAFVVVALAVVSLLFEDAVGDATPTDTPRPTLATITPTCEVFLPHIVGSGITPIPTPRPTLEAE